MAKKRAGASASTTWLTEYLCDRRGCGRTHPVCVTATRKPADADWLAYVCPTTRMPAGLRFGDVIWREVRACPAGVVVLRPPKSPPAQ
jgi:hypothetical protein